MRRTRLKPRSEKKIAADALKPPVREAVFRRDNYRCLMAGRFELGDCLGPMTPHHLRKDGQGGAYSVENLVTLCAHHNAAVEWQADTAWALGLVQRNGDSIEECWSRMRFAGLVP